MAHVFISYKHEDRDFALLVKSEIERAGFDTWIDSRLSAGESWVRNIDVALRDAFAVILILTPLAHESKYVTYEWSFALGREIPVIPILRKPVGEKELHQRLGDIQSLDFQHHEPWDDLHDALKKSRERYLALQKLESRSEEFPSESVEQPEDAGTAVLLDSLDSRRDGVRLGAIKVLGAVRQRKAVPQLISIAIDDDDASVRNAAVKALGQIGDLSTLPVLHTLLLGDKFSHIRRSAAEALWRIGSPESIPVLSEALSESEWENRLMVVRAFGGIDHSDANGGIRRGLRDSDVDVRMEAVVACELKRDPALVKALLPLLNDTGFSPVYNHGSIAERTRDVLEAIGTEEALRAVAEYDARTVDGESVQSVDDLPF